MRRRNDFGLRIPETGKMQKEEFLKRTMNFGLWAIRLLESLPKHQVATVFGNQLLRAGISAEANYRAAGRGKSRTDFIAKMGIVEEECDETLYWMEDADRIWVGEAGSLEGSRGRRKPDPLYRRCFDTHSATKQITFRYPQS
jgi:four helix bundle protein